MGIKLTPREFDILATLDKPQPEALKELGISVGNYKRRYYSLSKKFNVHTRVAMVIKALKLGLIELESYDSCPIRNVF